jgi:AcrR family transcriptional regulator
LEVNSAASQACRKGRAALLEPVDTTIVKAGPSKTGPSKTGQGKAGERRKPTQDRAVVSHAKIIDGAKRLLGDKGFSEFSMRNLARTSGVGLGTIYDYFPSWKDIVRVLLEERFELRHDILTATLKAISFEQGLTVFVPAYLKRLSDKGFWCSYDLHLRDAANAAADLNDVFERQENRIADRYVDEMQRAGSPWNRDDLMQLAQTNMTVSQMIVGDAHPSKGPEKEGRELQLRLVTEMILANLRLALRPQIKSTRAPRLKNTIRERKK